MFLSASVTFLLSLTLTFLTPAVHAQEIEPTGNFLLRVTRGRATDAPRLNNIYVSLTSTGQAIINTTTPATPYYGFPVRLNPGPEYGKVYERGTGRRGYLKPKATGSPHYEFFWKKTVPTTPLGIKSSNFTIQGRDCGAMCGGIDFRYNSREQDISQRKSTFFAVPYGGGVDPNSKVWSVLYTDDYVLKPIPTGGVEVILWWVAEYRFVPPA